MCRLNSNRLVPYYMGLKHTGELWVYIGTPLPNPSGNTGVMVCMYVKKKRKVIAVMLDEDINCLSRDDLFLVPSVTSFIILGFVE